MANAIADTQKYVLLFRLHGNNDPILKE